MKTKRQLKMFDKEEFQGWIRERIRTKIEEATETFVIPRELECLAAEARKYDSAEEFEKAFTRELKHGRYWHVTENANFEIDPELGPRDMSSMAMGDMEKGKLMVTSDLEYWADEYEMGAEEYGATPRKYVAEIDMSEVPESAYKQVNRGFGNEFFVSVPSKAKVIKVIPVEQAIKESREFQKALEINISNKEDLIDFYNQVIAESNTQEEECEDCKLSVGVGMALNVCKTLNYPDCDDLYGKIMNGEVDADEVVDMLIKRAKKSKNKEEHEVLKEIKKVMHMPLSEVRGLGE